VLVLQTTFEYLGFAALSKLFAAVTTYPYQVVRARLQDQHQSEYLGALDCIRKIVRYEGVAGLYKVSKWALHLCFSTSVT